MDEQRSRQADSASHLDSRPRLPHHWVSVRAFGRVIALCATLACGTEKAGGIGGDGGATGQSSGGPDAGTPGVGGSSGLSGRTGPTGDAGLIGNGGATADAGQGGARNSSCACTSTSSVLVLTTSLDCFCAGDRTLLAGDVYTTPDSVALQSATCDVTLDEFRAAVESVPFNANSYYSIDTYANCGLVEIVNHIPILQIRGWVFRSDTGRLVGVNWLTGSGGADLKCPSDASRVGAYQWSAGISFPPRECVLSSTWSGFGK